MSDEQVDNEEQCDADDDSENEKKKSNGRGTDYVRHLQTAMSMRGFIVFVDQNGATNAFTSRGQRKGAVGVESEEFKNDISRTYYVMQRKLLPKTALDGFLRLLKDEALSQPPVVLHNRVGCANGIFYYDLTNKEGEAIQLDDAGWQKIVPPMPLFKREKHQLPQVEPQIVEGKTLSAFLDKFQLDAKSKLLLVVWVHVAFIAGVPLALLEIYGSKGARKSSICRVLKRIIDPSRIELTTLVENPNELTQRLSHSYCLALDNLSYLSDENSDNLCRAITGDASSKRVLYSNDDDFIYSFQRKICTNSINPVVRRSDLLDRSIVLELKAVQVVQRKTEREFFEEFEEWRSAILGNILDVLVKARAIRKTLSLKELPRMADFTEWGESVARAIGYAPNEFLDAYNENRRDQTISLLSADLIVTRLVSLLETHSGDWRGTVTELYEAFGGNDPNQKDNKAWPKSASALTRHLNYIKPNLEEIGIKFDSEFKRTGAKKTMRVWKEPELHAPELPEARDWK